MAITERLKRVLDAERVRYEVLPHHEEFTAQRVAAASDVPGRQVAKVLICRDDAGRLLMAVLPAACRIDLVALQAAAGTGKLSLATEAEFEPLFPDCETGAMPPFGTLWNMPLYVDACFPRAKDFVFQGGNHHEVVVMPYEAYERIAKPVAGEFCLEKRVAAA
jgi:Ala-tRNA(Pro) deacylase